MAIGVEWEADAACKGTPTDVFFPSGSGPQLYRAAKAVCVTCRVTDECLREAMRAEGWGRRPTLRWGMFGGLSPSERDRLDREDIAA